MQVVKRVINNNIGAAVAVTDITGLPDTGVTYAELSGLVDAGFEEFTYTQSNDDGEFEQSGLTSLGFGDALESCLSDYFFNTGEMKRPPLVHGCGVADEISALDFREAALLGRLKNGEGVYLNTHEPFCFVTVGVQGAGKSHTLACVLESCLLPFPEASVIRLDVPMTALVLHYDQSINSVCEATGLLSPTRMLQKILGPAAMQRCVPKVHLFFSPQNNSLPIIRVCTCHHVSHVSAWLCPQSTSFSTKKESF
jgi:hypothetical protein